MQGEEEELRRAYSVLVFLEGALGGVVELVEDDVVGDGEAG